MGGERTERLPASATDVFTTSLLPPPDHLLYFTQVSNLGISKNLSEFQQAFQIPVNRITRRIQSSTKCFKKNGWKSRFSLHVQLMKKGRGLTSNEITVCSLKCVLLDFQKAPLSLSVSLLIYAAMKLCQPHVLGRLWQRFTFLGCGHQRNEKLLFRLDSGVHECTTGSVFLLKEIKNHIKTQHILGRKDKNTKRACLIFRNAILSFVSSGIQLARLPSLFKS